MNDESKKEISDLSMTRVECKKCGAMWLNGQHYWRGTGNKTKNSELDLAGLVCNKYGDEQCINPMKGRSGGDTWEDRLGEIQSLTKDVDFQ